MTSRVVLVACVIVSLATCAVASLIIREYERKACEPGAQISELQLMADGSCEPLSAFGGSPNARAIKVIGKPLCEGSSVSVTVCSDTECNHCEPRDVSSTDGLSSIAPVDTPPLTTTGGRCHTSTSFLKSIDNESTTNAISSAFVCSTEVPGLCAESLGEVKKPPSDAKKQDCKDAVDSEVADTNVQPGAVLSGFPFSCTGRWDKDNKKWAKPWQSSELPTRAKEKRKGLSGCYIQQLEDHHKCYQNAEPLTEQGVGQPLKMWNCLKVASTDTMRFLYDVETAQIHVASDPKLCLQRIPGGDSWMHTGLMLFDCEEGDLDDRLWTYNVTSKHMGSLRQSKWCISSPPSEGQQADDLRFTSCDNAAEEIMKVHWVVAEYMENPCLCSAMRAGAGPLLAALAAAWLVQWFTV